MPLPLDAKLVTDPLELSTLLADHTARGIHLPDGTRWREFSAADGRTVWEFHGCLHPGKWWVSGSTVCYAYPSWDGGRPACFLVFRSARLTHFVWLDSDSNSEVLLSNADALDPGNPDQMPLEGAPTCGDPGV